MNDIAQWQAHALHAARVGERAAWDALGEHRGGHVCLATAITALVDRLSALEAAARALRAAEDGTAQHEYSAALDTLYDLVTPTTGDATR